MGKTVMLHHKIREQPAAKYFILDRTGDWRRGAPHWCGKPPALLQSFPLDSKLPEVWPDAGVFVFPAWEAAPVARLAIANGPSVVVDDEIDLSGGKTGAWEDNPYREIIHRGRHLPDREGVFQEVHLYGACRRPQSLHTDFAIADQVHIFRCQGQATLARLRSDDYIRDEDMETIRTLPKLRFLHWPSGKYFDVAV